MLRLITPIIFIIFGGIYLILTFNMTRAKIGDPNAPLYFPALIGIFLVIISIVYFVQEWKQRKETVEEVKQLFKGRTPFLIIASLVLIFIYSFLFERIGFLYSTILFLTGLLFVVNGRKQWIKNILIAVIFSFVAWYSFAELLDVSLP
ncbi:tripartite tricarboxylate transporter TctB family protein [Virgibacillus ndiopensis]|uniref:tripartite tricarboxylate transporter TctB family protein n=1 Tax=Virgibacillus ndiopensis TaxID=2004408 RepID=UPI000C06C4EC|nr:tripartite tricarboxylate transporter TctB family protein [Virgibacillus ndiopensis]